MKKFRVFYHYSKFIEQIKRDKLLLATSFAKTYTYDWVLEFCPEEFLNKKEIKRLKQYQKKNKKIVQSYKREQENGENYESCYRNLKLKFKNPILTEFFNRDGYILAFSKKFEKGWTNEDKKQKGVFEIFKKIGNRYVRFIIDHRIAKKCYVLEQKFWNEEYPKPILEKVYGNGFTKLEKAFEDEVFRKKKNKLKKYKQFKKDFVRLMFYRYYNSITKLDVYKNDFKIPEFWIGEDIPINQCKFGKVSFHELQKKCGLHKEDIIKRKPTNADIAERKKKNSRSSIINRNLK